LFIQQARMQIKNINFSDSVFISLFEDFCLSSKPLPQMDEGSLSRRLSCINDYRNELSSISEISLVAIDGEKKPIMYSFFRLSANKDFVFMDFILPNIRMTSTSNIIKYQLAFCESFLHVYEKTGLDLVEAELNRLFKKEKLIKTLKRFVPAFTLIENKKGEVCSVKVEKNNVIKFYEKLQIKNNRNK